MHSSRIVELLEPFLGLGSEERITTVECDQISTYIDILLRWNARVNLTAIRDPELIVTRHFGESLFAARQLFPDREQSKTQQRPTHTSLADIGSGAGFPGLPIKLWVSHLSATLIESNHKKAAFLREVIRKLTLTNIDVVTERAETLGERAFDVVTLRAVERFESILPIAANLVAPGGRFALLISEPQIPQAQSLLENATVERLEQSLTWNWDEPIPIPLSTSRRLVITTR